MLRALSVIAGLLIAGAACAADPPKVTDLVRQLETGGAGERVIAAERLGDLGSAAADAIPALTRVARNARRGSLEGGAESRRAKKHLYEACLDALSDIGPQSVPALVELLPGEKDDFFGSVAWRIRSFGRDAAPAVPTLAKLLADENQDFRVSVASAWKESGREPNPQSQNSLPCSSTRRIRMTTVDRQVRSPHRLGSPPCGYWSESAQRLRKPFKRK